MDKLELRKALEVKVRYANNKVEMKLVYRAAAVEILGREGTFDVIGGEKGSQPPYRTSGFRGIGPSGRSKNKETHT